MNYNRPIVLSIAGFDPTGGAGVLADVKTCEQLRCLGMGVLTANTNQTEADFRSVDWMTKETLIAQLEPLLQTYALAAVKIGIVENLDTLQELVAALRTSFPAVPIVWDPVLSASSGFELHASWDETSLQALLETIDLVTPNVQEIRRMTGIEDEIDAAFHLGKRTNVLLKGGHSTERLGVDILFEGRISLELPATAGPENYAPKHGSGCILSTAIACRLASGDNLQDACRNAKHYIEKRLSSNENLLAYHVE